MSSCQASSDQPDVFCSRPFGSTAFRVVYPLPFAEGVKRRVLHGRVVEEQFAPLTLNEPKTFSGNQFFDRALWHTTTYSLKRYEKQKRTMAAQPSNPSRQSGARVARAGAPKSTAIKETSAASRNRATGEEESRRKLKGLADLHPHNNQCSSSGAEGKGNRKFSLAKFRLFSVQTSGISNGPTPKA